MSRVSTCLFQSVSQLDVFLLFPATATCLFGPGEFSGGCPGGVLELEPLGEGGGHARPIHYPNPKGFVNYEPSCRGFRPSFDRGAPVRVQRLQLFLQEPGQRRHGDAMARLKL